MKKLKKIKLSHLINEDLQKREMGFVLGGASCCICSCRGNSGDWNNGHANRADGLSTYGGYGNIVATL